MSELRDDEILAMVCADIEDNHATKEAQVAEVMRLAHEYAICNGEELISRKVKGPEAKALVHATQGAIAALDAAVRKLVGLPANSETAARAETE